MRTNVFRPVRTGAEADCAPLADRTCFGAAILLTQSVWVIFDCGRAQQQAPMSAVPPKAEVRSGLVSASTSRSGLMVPPSA